MVTDQRHHLPPHPPRPATVVCCPWCTAAQVRIRTARGEVARLECVACGHQWRTTDPVQRLLVVV